MSANKLESLFQEQENQADDKTSEVYKRSKLEERKRRIKEFLELFIEVQKVRTEILIKKVQTPSQEKLD